MPVQAELVWTVTQSARLSKDQGPLNKEALSLVSLTCVKSVTPGYGGHTSPLLCLSSPHALHSLPAAKKTCEVALMVTEISPFPSSHLPMLKHETYVVAELSLQWMRMLLLPGRRTPSRAGFCQRWAHSISTKHFFSITFPQETYSDLSYANC